MVIRVDEKDNPIGQSDKMEAHRKGHLHRAFSVIIVNSRGELLLQQRAHNKYHSAGLWTNTCCSHPTPGEDTLESARRRLKEEMGMETELTFLFKFQYCTVCSNDLIEHEMDSVYMGYSDELPRINHTEVNDYKYMKIENIEKDMLKNPGHYTVWFNLIFNRLVGEHRSLVPGYIQSPGYGR